MALEVQRVCEICILYIYRKEIKLSEDNGKRLEIYTRVSLHVFFAVIHCLFAYKINI